MSDVEVRRLPKKTIVIISIMVILIGGIYLFFKDLKEKKMIEILATLGHKNINHMEVINKLSVEDKVTRYKSKVYKVRFFDNTTNKTCIGFIHFGKNNKYSKDVDCK